MPESGAPNPTTERAPASPSQQEFLLRLSDALRPLTDPVALEGAACRLLGEHLAVDRASYIDIDEAAGVARVGRDWVRDGEPSLVGEHGTEAFGWSVALLRRGACYAISDTQTSALVPSADRPAAAALKIVACMGAPLIKGTALVGALCVTAAQPRVWSEGDAGLLREVGQRLWDAVERAYAERALAASEANYRALFGALDQGFCTIEVLFDAQGQAVDYRFLDMNSAFVRQTGLEQAVGRTIRELAPQHEPYWFEVYGEIALTGEARRFEERADALNPPRHYDVYAFRIGEPHQHQVAVLFSDISERKQAEATIQELNRTLEARVEVRTRELIEERAALDAVVAFTEAVGDEAEEDSLAQHAITTIAALLSPISVAYYQLDQGLWKATVWSDEVPSEVVDQMRRGISQDAPHLAEAVRGREPVFVEGWDAVADQIDQATMYGAAAFVPLFVDGEQPRILAVGTQDARLWTAREQAVVRAVGRSLNLALERTQATRRLQQQNLALEARTQALEGFAALTRDLALDADRYALIHRAQQLARSLLPHGFAVYYEPAGDLWRLKAQVGDVGNPALQAALDAGLSFTDTPNLLIPWQSGAPHYQDAYDHAADHLPEETRQLQTTATLPVLVNGVPTGIFAYGSNAARPWSRADRAVLESVASSLGSAIDRVEQTRQLAEERAALDAFVAFTEVVGSEVEEGALAARAVEVLRATLGEVSVVYYQRRGETWQARATSPDLGPELLTSLQRGVTVTAPHFVEALRTSDPLFLSRWSAHDDQVPEAASYQAVAVMGCFIGPQVCGLLSIGSVKAHDWTARERAVFQAVGRALSGALERAHQTRQVERQRDELDLRTRALETANEELEAFNYSVSHDLMTPVRHVAGFTHLVEKHLDNPTKARQYLGIVNQGARRMETLIEAMLTLSRTGRREMSIGVVDLGALVEQAQLDALSQLADRPIEWRIGTLPLVRGDRVTLQQVMTNLLSNAVKFSQGRDPAVIEVWAEERAQEWTISVRDNGAGFDPRYTDKLFGIFQRLHRHEEFEGTGVGLSLVRRIIARHGGTVGATGAVGQGATFSFTLPKPSALPERGE